MKKLMLTLSLSFCTITSSFAGSGHSSWGYSGPEGPSHWGDLSAKNISCGIGKNQSPINFPPSNQVTRANLQNIQFNYQNSPLEVVNNGHTIQANYAPGSTITIEGQTFQLLQFHFHSQSEHQLVNKSFPLEAHLVHADSQGNLAVVGVFFHQGRANPLIDQVWQQMPPAKGKKSDPSQSINAIKLLPNNRNYIRYNGSLTTPPCSEGVKWMVIINQMEASQEQIEKFRHVLHHDNNRPVQPINARPILTR